MNPLRSTSHGLVCGLLVFLLCSCGGGSSTPPPSNNPAPSIQSISPNSAAAGSNGFTLTITGSNFLSSSTVAWNSNSRKATFVSSSQLTIAVAASDLGASGTIAVAVTNPTPGGGQASANFTINPPGVPAVTSVSPNTLGAGTSAIALTVTGTGFIVNSVVQWNGSSRPTTYVSNTQLTVSIPASDLINPLSSLPITVMTPSPGGGTSNTVPVAVVSAVLPTITSLSPSQGVLGGPAFTLTVNGTNFVGGANVYWNGISRVTQFVSSTQLTASILASDITLPSSTNTASITVENPTPNAGISAPVTMTLENPAPTITSLSPNTGVAGALITVAITGTGFASGATVQFGGQVLPSTYNSPTSLSVTLTAAVGPANLTVSNPVPAAGPSNAVPFTGTAAGQGVQLTVVSVDSSGNTVSEGPGTIDASGRYFSFFDASANLFLRDTCLGAPSGCTPATGLYGNFASLPGNAIYTFSYFSTSWISTNGQYVFFLGTYFFTSAFSQSAYIVDTCLGISSGGTPGGILTTVPNTNGAIMAEAGRYLSYGTGGGGDTPANAAYLYDTCIGAPQGCSQATVATVTNDPITVPVANSDGRYLVYENTSARIILHDSCLTAAPGCAPSEETVSDTTMACQSPTISPDAAYLAWTCGNGNVGPAYLQGTCFGLSSGCSTTPFKFASGASPSSPLAISDGGRFTAFEQPLSGLVEIYVYDNCNSAPPGCKQQAIPISLNSTGAVANAYSNLVGMSNDGKYILFSSAATNLVTLPGGLSGNVSYIAVNPLQ
jgi:hypothetical protein